MDESNIDGLEIHTLIGEKAASLLNKEKRPRGPDQSYTNDSVPLEEANFEL